MPEMIKIKACAKLNLCLEVLGKRPDGFHNISSVFHQVDLCDELEFAAASDGRITLTCDDPRLPVNEKNLVIRAAHLLRSFESKVGSSSQACTETDNLPYRRSDDRLPGAKITLTKRIPVGAGLGGGSADGAAALTGLAQLWSVKLGSEDLHKMALELGSDVPYFISGGTAYVSGRGENIEPLKSDKTYHFVIVYPGFGVSTAWAYKSLKNQLTKDPEYSKILYSIWAKGPEASEIAKQMHNDLENAVIPAHPPIARIKEMLMAQGAAGSMMSGSGSCVFGIFPDEVSARLAHTKLKLEYPKSFYVRSLI
jgi:4-diphosphocytidyl-2-C-methyl-D-erythritol kinase